MVGGEPYQERSVPQFSIVLPVLNRADVIKSCLESLLGQRGPSFEVIVIDGGSTDGTVDTIQGYSDSLAYWESKRDEGIYHAWNKGLKHAKGRWIGFLGADDRFASDDVLAKMADVVALLPRHVSVIYPHAIYMDDKGVAHEESGMAWKSARGRLFQGVMTVPPGVFYRRDVFERNGGFDTAFKICGDFDMVLREARTHDAQYIDSVSMIVGIGGVSWKTENKMRIMTETRASLRKNGIKGVPWHWYVTYLKMTPASERLRKWVGPFLRRLGVRRGYPSRCR